MAIASSAAVARVAAQATDIAAGAGRTRGGTRVPGAAAGETALAAGVPGELAAEAQALGERLPRWGIRTLGAVAALPGDEVTVRLGRVGAWLHALASGRAEEPFAPRLPPDALEEGTDLDYPIYEIEPLAFMLRGLLDRALARLQLPGPGLRRAWGCGSSWTPRASTCARFQLAAPSREAATLLQLVRLDLARRPPAAAVVGLARAGSAGPRARRASWISGGRPVRRPRSWRPRSPAWARWSVPENVGAPALVDSYREEAVDPAGLRAGRELSTGRRREAGEPRLGFRRFRPPRPLEVLMDRDGPAALRAEQLVARVLVAAGPYRSSGEWWSEEVFSRDYWDVHASDGAVYRLHQERRTGTWFLDGYYD